MKKMQKKVFIFGRSYYFEINFLNDMVDLKKN